MSLMRLRNALAAGVIAAVSLPAPAAMAATPAMAVTPAVTATAATAARLPLASADAPSAPAAVPEPPPVDARPPGCGTASRKEFPIDTRIHGGPAAHHPGGGFEQWSVDLTNTT
ncbi:hypothetical protein ACWF94_04230, partial [Streptomyces sp. NPDC055078]